MPHPCNNSSRLLSLNVMYLYCYVCVINDGYLTVLKLNTYYDKKTFEFSRLVQACPNYMYFLTYYRRSGFNCEDILIANCEFFCFAINRFAT